MKWKLLKNYEEFYEISENGDLRSILRKHESANRFGKMQRTCGGRPLKAHHAANGYLMSELNCNKQIKKVLIHRLVYENFVGDIKKGFVIHHKDENKLNNHYSNLEQLDYTTHNRIHSHPAWNKGLKGFRAGEKRDPNIYKNQRKRVKCVETGEVFESIKDLSAITKKSPSRISQCLKENKKIGDYKYEYY